MFLYNNYRQALDILDDGRKSLAHAMWELDISSISVFEEWLKEEKTYLAGLKQEPEETLKIEYWQALVDLETAE